MKISRKGFIFFGLGSVAAAALSPKAAAQLVEKPQDWSQTDFRRLMHRTARYRQVYDVAKINNGVFLNNIKNSLNGFQFSFGSDRAEINLVAALHGAANLLNFDDAMWAKYQLGEFADVKDPKTGAPATRNIFFPSSAVKSNRDPEDERSIYQDRSIQGLQARGVHFLICHTATEEQSRRLIKRFGLKDSPETIVKDLIAHRIPGTMVVPSMVTVIAILQLEGQFSYITVA